MRDPTGEKIVVEPEDYSAVAVDEGGESKVERMIPLFVDLDGTLVASDLLWETALEFSRAHLGHAWQIPFWLVTGRANLKQRLAEATELDFTTLPYRREVVEYVRQQREEGRPIILATASDERLANAVAEHLGLFDHVLASNGTNNLKGAAKLEAIQRWCGPGGRFDYIGDAAVDLPIWSVARRSIVVSPSASLLNQTQGLGESREILGKSGGTLKAALKAARPHQWAKNTLLFVAVLMAHRWFDWIAVGRAMAAFIAFSMSASSAYLINDLLDLRFDRNHPRKRLRSVASGKLPIPFAIALAVGLLGVALVISAAVSPAFLGMVLLYVAMTLSYSLYLKRKLMVDVLCLAGLYTLRIIAGGVATEIPISFWMLSFSMFLFLSLAFAKRYTELDQVETGPGSIVGRGYRPADLDMVRILGGASGYLCVMTIGWYINSEDVIRLYHRPWLLWILCPVILYWISRVWFLANRRELHHDPVVFALGDKISYISGLIVGLAVLLAR